MSDVAISALATATTPADADYLVIVQSGVTCKIAASDFFGRPRAIGSTTAAAGSFTTVNATGAGVFGSNIQASATAGATVAKFIGRASDNASNILMYKNDGTTLIGDFFSTVSTVGMEAGSGKAEVNTSGVVISGTLTPVGDNLKTLGDASHRWSVVYAGTGTINTSDAREKTAVKPMSAAEIAAARQLGQEIGTYRWLDAVADKGDAARWHVGFTVQRVIEIMQANGLDPMEYGFICHDRWDDVFVDHPEIPGQDYRPAVTAQATLADGRVVTVVLEPEVPAVEARAAWREQTQRAGDRYAFRYDELNLFIARGFEARLAALEARA